MKRGTYVRTPEIRAKIGAKSRANWQDPEFREKVANGCTAALKKRLCIVKPKPVDRNRAWREKVRKILGREAAEMIP